MEGPIAQKCTVHCHSECELRLRTFAAPGDMATSLLPGAIRIVHWNKFAPQSFLVIYTPPLESCCPALFTLSGPFFHSRATIRAYFLQRTAPAFLQGPYNRHILVLSTSRSNLETFNAPSTDSKSPATSDARYRLILGFSSR